MNNYYDITGCELMVVAMLEQAIDFARGENMSAFGVNGKDCILEQSECVNFLLSEDFTWYTDLLYFHDVNIKELINHAVENLEVYQPSLFVKSLAKTATIG